MRCRADRQVPEYETVCATSEIREEKRFSKQDVLKLIALSAMAQGLDLNKLRVSMIASDKEGVLLILKVKSPNENGDGGYAEFSYTIKGRYEAGQASVTMIEVTYCDKDDMPENGNTIADYNKGKWSFVS